MFYFSLFIPNAKAVVVETTVVTANAIVSQSVCFGLGFSGGGTFTRISGSGFTNLKIPPFLTSICPLESNDISSSNLPVDSIIKSFLLIITPPPQFINHQKFNSVH